MRGHSLSTFNGGGQRSRVEGWGARLRWRPSFPVARSRDRPGSPTYLAVPPAGVYTALGRLAQGSFALAGGSDSIERGAHPVLQQGSCHGPGARAEAPGRARLWQNATVRALCPCRNDTGQEPCHQFPGGWIASSSTLPKRQRGHALSSAWGSRFGGVEDENETIGTTTIPRNRE